MTDESGSFLYAAFQAMRSEDDSLEGSERDRLEKVEKLLLRLSTDEQQRSTIKDDCWEETQKTLDGRDAHHVIW